MKWTSQEPAVLQSYRRAYRLDTPSTFKNPLSHVVLGQGIGRMSPTMARAKSKRRVQKDQLALAVRKNFNALGVNESDVIVDWLYKSKHQGAYTGSIGPDMDHSLTPHIQTRSFAYDSRRNASELELAHTTHHHAHPHTHTHTHAHIRFFTFESFYRYPVAAR